MVSGRYHRGADLFRPEESWAALYCGLAREVCVGEIVRHMDADLLPLLNDYLLTELHIELSAVADYRDLASIGLTRDALLVDYDVDVPQRLAAVARERGAEGLIVPSATLLGDVLVIFPDRLRDGSKLEALGSTAMRLYVER